MKQSENMGARRSHVPRLGRCGIHNLFLSHTSDDHFTLPVPLLTYRRRRRLRRRKQESASVYFDCALPAPERNYYPIRE